MHPWELGRFDSDAGRVSTLDGAVGSAACRARPSRHPKRVTEHGSSPRPLNSTPSQAAGCSGCIARPRLISRSLLSWAGVPGH
jgi:hypothetical protein